MKSFIQLSLVTSTILGVAIETQAATFIDNFAEGVIDLEVSPTNLVESASVTAPGILGGTRKIELALTVFEDEAFASTNLFTTNNFSHSNNTGASSIASITYDAAGKGLGVDLTKLGDSFAIQVTDIDLANQFEIFVKDNEDRVASVVSENVTTPTTVLFDFADFTGVNLSRINQIDLVSHGGLNVDVDIDSFSIFGKPAANIPDTALGDSAATPETTTILGLLFVGGLSFLVRPR